MEGRLGDALARARRGLRNVGQGFDRQRALSGRICRILGSEPPAGFTYELFLDEQAQKISKSRGNGLSVEEWLRYAPPESLAQFMFNQPQRAKRLYFDVIPKAVDEYLANALKARGQEAAEQPGNPAWHIHAGQVPAGAHSPLSFAMLQNLASVANADTPDILWGFIRRYNPDATPERMPFLAGLVEYALAYYRDFVRPKKQFRDPAPFERAALADLAEGLRALPADADGETIQATLYEVGKRHPFPELRAWFGCLYQVLLGQQEGPRFGQFVALYGIAETIGLIEEALARAGRRRLTRARRLGETLKSGVRHLPAVLGVLLLGGAIYVVQKEFRNLKIEDIEHALEAIPDRTLAIAFLCNLVSYGILTFYDRLGTYYAGRSVSYVRVAFASFCAYALAHNLGFAAVSGAAVRYRLYAHWGLTPLQIAKVVGFCSLTFGLGGMVLGGIVLFFEPEAVPFFGALLPLWVLHAIGGLMWAVVAGYVTLSRVLRGRIDVRP